MSPGMNETSVDEKLHEWSAPVVAGMTMADSQGSHTTALRGLKPAFASFIDQNAFSAEYKSSWKRRLKEISQKQQETEDYDENRAVSEISLSSEHSSEDEMGASSLKDDGRAVASSPRGTCLSHGSASVIGRRRVMEDAVAIELGFLTMDNSREYDFFGVYDGHGGSRVANSCQGRLHHLLVEEYCKTTSYFGEDAWSKIMINCFLKMDEEVNSSDAPISSNNESHSSTIGSTALVAVVGEDEVVIANCGDSRAVLSRGGIPLSISNDHKPDRPDELERIENAGGRVIDWDGHRVLGVLATSRSIGDQYLQPFVIPEPEVTLTKRGNVDEFLILATDGLWDVVTNEIACLAVKRCLEGRSLKKRRSVGEIQEENDRRREGRVECKMKKKKHRRAEVAACMLVDLALARGSKDNISVVVVDLNKARKQEEEEVEAKSKGKKGDSMIMLCSFSSSSSSSSSSPFDSLFRAVLERNKCKSTSQGYPNLSFQILSNLARWTHTKSIMFNFEPNNHIKLSLWPSYQNDMFVSFKNENNLKVVFVIIKVEEENNMCEPTYPLLYIKGWIDGEERM